MSTVLKVVVFVFAVNAGIGILFVLYHLAYWACAVRKFVRALLNARNKQT
jgi:hypothetical protein